MRKPTLSDIVHDVTDRLGDCKGAVEMAVASMLESSEPEQAQANAIGALTLAAKELKRIQAELDAAASNVARPQAVRLLRSSGAEVANG